MNTKLLELAQAATRKYDRLGNEIPVAQPNLEEFAKLIIQECAKICDAVQQTYGQYTFTARVCKEDIKQHFGVEE
jgi:hypothetical protein